MVEKSEAAGAGASDANHFCKQQQLLQMEHMATDDSGKMSTNSGFSLKPGACLTPFCLETAHLHLTGVASAAIFLQPLHLNLY